MRNKKQGFTLIELMVVVVIAAVLMGAVTLSFPDSATDRLKKQGDRFTALISLAQDEAILQSQDFALSINDSGYSFYRREGENWEAYSDKPFVDRKIPTDIKTEMYLEGELIVLKDANKAGPQIVVFSSGEMTPFTYILSYAEKSVITIKVDAAGNLEQTFKEDEEE